MTNREVLIAYLATLVALAVVFLGAMLIGANAPDVIAKIGDFGLGTITGGLIGVLRMPSRTGISDQTAQTLADKVPPVTGDAATDPAPPAPDDQGGAK